MLVRDLYDDLCIVNLLLFRFHREPEPRATASYEGCETLEHVLPVMFVSKPLRFLADNLFSPLCGDVCSPERRIRGQPDIDVREVRQVFGKVLRMQHRQEQAAQSQNGQGTCKHTPAMPQSKIAHPVIEPGEAMRASLGHGRVSTLRRLDQVIRNE